ncbi:uncharacterized protein LOC113147109 [Cyclospora cayetanensis]|uniref:Uncharacterized protein LOC113147109 n=1 Tax=Cyclospora cayetanensis TaxID=88456 RepID=A0A6P6RWI6_9EIME|nr:uncharacterized protein LOC113147109 [Cyclospora cayetanensis]
MCFLCYAGAESEHALQKGACSVPTVSRNPSLLLPSEKAPLPRNSKSEWGPFLGEAAASSEAAASTAVDAGGHLAEGAASATGVGSRGSFFAFATALWKHKESPPQPEGPASGSGGYGALLQQPQSDHLPETPQAVPLSSGNSGSSSSSSSSSSFSSLGTTRTAEKAQSACEGQGAEAEAKALDSERQKSLTEQQPCMRASVSSQLSEEGVTQQERRTSLSGAPQASLSFFTYFLSALQGQTAVLPDSGGATAETGGAPPPAKQQTQSLVEASSTTGITATAATAGQHQRRSGRRPDQGDPRGIETARQRFHGGQTAFSAC